MDFHLLQVDSCTVTQLTMEGGVEDPPSFAPNLPEVHQYLRQGIDEKGGCPSSTCRRLPLGKHQPREQPGVAPSPL